MTHVFNSSLLKHNLLHTIIQHCPISEEEYFKEYNKLPRPLGIKAEQLVFKDQGIEADMFRPGKATSGYFVSERLKNKMEEEGITGFKFIPEEEVVSVR